VLDPPSPKVQDHEVGEPVEVSVNCTVRGGTPDVGAAVKEATGEVAAVAAAVVVVGAVTVMESDSIVMLLPAEFMAVRETV
jgi:ribosomal protein L21E